MRTILIASPYEIDARTAEFLPGCRETFRANARKVMAENPGKPYKITLLDYPEDF